MTSDPETQIQALLRAYHLRAHVEAPARVDPEDAGVPPSMADGPGRFPDTLRWRLVESTVSERDLDALERRLGHPLPPLYRAYLRAYCHLFDQVRSKLHDQLVMLPAMPDDRPLTALRALVDGFRPLLEAGLVPIAEWGDGWGPVCLDASRRDAEGDCAVVWLDHEVFFDLGPEVCADRARLEPHLRPLYESARALLDDLFG